MNSNSAALIRLWSLVCLFGAWAGAGAASLEFSNEELANVGRVEIRVDGPETPADIGATDFTLEFWMMSASGNSAVAVGCNRSGYNWIEGNIVFDRDRLSGTRDFGLAIAGGVIVFGVENSGSYTICSNSSVLNGQWRHIAVQRRRSDGWLWIYVDGVLEQQADGPDGDVSYPNGTGSGKEPLLVIGREKYDLGPDGFRGWIDEVRLSTTLRYSGNFTVPTQPFSVDASTAALYHFDEGSGDTIVDQNGNQSPGIRRFSSTAGPQWSTETPFTGGPGTVQFAAATYSVAENGGALTVTVTRTGGSSGAATVDIAATGGTATSGADYQFTPATLSWASGESGTKTRTITVADDADVESNETVVLSLSNATGAALGTPSVTTATITDNDVPPSGGTLQFSNSTYSVSEGTATLAITVSRTGGSAGAASVDVGVTGGTATSGSDYQLTPATLSWADGQGGTRTFTVTITNDTAVEGNETIVLGLSTASGAALGTPATATVTVADDDPAPTGTLDFSAATYTVNEADGTFVVGVTRSGGSAGSASVTITATAGTATSADYQLPTTTLTWAAGESGERTVSGSLTNDASVEQDETIVIELSNAVGANLGSVRSTTVTIRDNDVSQPPPTDGGGGGGGGGAIGAWWIAAGLFAIAARRRQGLASHSRLLKSRYST